MPCGGRMLFEKAHVTIKEGMQVRNLFKAMTKTKSNEDVFQNKVAEHAVEDAAITPVYTFQYF